MVATPNIASANGDTCDGGSSWFGACTHNDGSSVSVEYNESYNSPSSNNGGGSNSGSNSGGGGGSAGREECANVAETASDRCQGYLFRPGDPSSPSASSGPTLPTSFSVNDILNIVPQTPTLNMEPNGWGLLGQPVNFWVDASTHRVNGTLLGHPVQVQFRPQSVRWDFGDGNSWSTNSLGSSWAAQGLPELSDTATSHRYTERGEVTVTAVVSYSATVFIAGTSIPVTGYVMATSTSLTFELYEQSTVLIPNP
ncbi:MAG: hypothetical protein ACTHXA_06350 [Gulosibacter sp.]|uniref:hypothetical protein n=1 Tax=Gulosibacter sp. TaxID=2817531 RepID=UPI003F9009A1